ncbi:uncharacterized protein UMAG_12311 [Mycosarcoma maydis]|uniref:Uncharacterized protein n=1 Tax=Mycosarcoma maydis TaxID=5270 RepID=A0A0D1BYA8_MYCMD|nr:uncharacterized protein UMAG_12311 [Ustilago maydis 521]KIS66857.1 hypothetical protein UMAG_12311 [Ustilago maydis 521]|eukprot:XP_011391577.1 hypothetical protein UMAG_12311 [Ustilago maydis 521]
MPPTANPSNSNATSAATDLPPVLIVPKWQPFAAHLTVADPATGENAPAVPKLAFSELPPCVIQRIDYAGRLEPSTARYGISPTVKELKGLQTEARVGSPMLATNINLALPPGSTIASFAEIRPSAMHIFTKTVRHAIAVTAVILATLVVAAPGTDRQSGPTIRHEKRKLSKDRGSRDSQEYFIQSRVLFTERRSRKCM